MTLWYGDLKQYGVLDDLFQFEYSTRGDRDAYLIEASGTHLKKRHAADRISNFCRS